MADNVATGSPLAAMLSTALSKLDSFKGTSGRLTRTSVVISPVEPSTSSTLARIVKVPRVPSIVFASILWFIAFTRVHDELPLDEERQLYSYCSGKSSSVQFADDMANSVVIPM